jgi:hypothetical protein
MLKMNGRRNALSYGGISHQPPGAPLVGKSRRATAIAQSIGGADLFDNSAFVDQVI